MIAPVDSGFATMLAIVGGLGALIGIAIYVWYAYALSRLFPRIDGEGWKGWVPILNEAEILARGGVPAWSVVFYFIPLVQLYGIYLKVVATHRINQRFGRGAGMTVLAILLPPVWATVLAWGAPPYPEGERLAALQPGPRRSSSPATAPARDASGYTIPSLAPHTQAQAQSDAPALIFPDYAAPPKATAPSESATSASAVAAPPSAWGAPPQPPQSPVGTPPVPGEPPATFASPGSHAPNTGAPAESFAPPAQPVAQPQPPAPQFTPQPPAPQFTPQPPAPPAASPEFAAQPSENSSPVDAHPTTGIMAAMGGDPVAAPSAVGQPAPLPPAPLPPAPQPPAPQPPAPQPPAPQPPAPQPPAPHDGARPEPPAVQFAPPAAPERPAETPGPSAEAPPIADPQRVVRPVPPSFRDGGADVEPQMPVIRPAPSGVADAAVSPAAPVPVPTDAPGPVAASAVPMPLGGLAADVDKTVVTPRPTETEVDDFDATVVVAHKRGVRRSLVLDDGRKFSLSGASVVIGRNPIGEPGEQRLAISDTTRTLSKTHARLVVHDDEWRLTDLHATNGVVVVEENGTETLLDPGESVTGNGRFILGEVGMHVMSERDS